MNFLKFLPKFPRYCFAYSKGGTNYLKITFIFFIVIFDENLMIIINNQRIFRAIQPELMRHRVYLGGKCEIGRCRIFIPDNDPYFVDNIVFSDAFEEWAGEAMGNDQSGLSPDKYSAILPMPWLIIFCSSDPGKFSYPVFTVSQKGLCIALVSKVITVDGSPCAPVYRPDNRLFTNSLIRTMAWVNWALWPAVIFSPF